jgi:hypothetical protein
MKQIREIFENQLCMPRCPVEEAMETLQQLTGQDFFAMGEGDLYV